MKIQNPKNPDRWKFVNYTTVVERTSKLRKARSKNDLEISDLKNKIEELVTDKEQLAPIILVQPPAVLAQPINRNKNLTLFASPAIGLFFMILLTFFLEYIRKSIAQNKSKSIF